MEEPNLTHAHSKDKLQEQTKGKQYQKRLEQHTPVPQRSYRVEERKRHIGEWKSLQQDIPSNLIRKVFSDRIYFIHCFHLIGRGVGPNKCCIFFFCILFISIKWWTPPKIYL